ncbi:hypothetical protein CC1G_04075 [Coprinopsis cinerea okayama7|uniref:DRBM domain-containing protein n=1 Tax=Coprinopsis cinerea (strain Okayama-7 / 130 / ATCC MYA-4618 / FGSC 9003) TaxID=240176 RepID=A8NVV5_COPC7|nr:hypothetical protein CC1G_04075 [Coprinopsis cinerea okayama7\|eukprot:XP_001836762.2 hypothetical protein CC1G_04075 [Coprinopsis cinerea okayama7\
MNINKPSPSLPRLTPPLSSQQNLPSPVLTMTVLSKSDACMHYNNACEKLFGKTFPPTVHEINKSEFKAEVRVTFEDGVIKLLGEGAGTSKQIAKNLACSEAYNQLRVIFPEYNLPPLV